MQLGHEVAVAIERGLNRGMPQLRLDVLRWAPWAIRDWCSVAEVVEAHPAEASAPERLRKLPVTEIIRHQWACPARYRNKLTASCGDSRWRAASSVAGTSIARRERLDFGVPSLPRQSARRT